MSTGNKRENINNNNNNNPERAKEMKTNKKLCEMLNTDRNRDRESAHEVKATSTVSGSIRLRFFRFFFYFPYAHTIRYYTFNFYDCFFLCCVVHC